MSTEFSCDGLRSSSSSQNSTKRKSFEEDGDEKENTNKSNEIKETAFQAKKLRSRDVIGAVSEIKVEVNAPATKMKSALPRFQQQAKPKGKTFASVVSTPSDKKRPTEHTASERLFATPCKTPGVKSLGQVQNTISKFEGLLSPGAANPTDVVLKKLRKCFQRTATGGDAIQTYFDNALTVDDARINQIIADGKVKSKWDYKEKSKKQDTVIKELRDCFTTTFSEVKLLRDNCVAHEAMVVGVFHDAHEELMEVSKVKTAFMAAEEKARASLQKAQEELKQANTAYAQYRSECSPVKNRTKAVEDELLTCRSALVQQEARTMQSEAQLLTLQKELYDIKLKSDEALRAQKDQFELSVASYKDDIAAMRFELNRKQSDAERQSGERADADKKKGELQEELVRTQSMLREAENSVKRLEGDAQRWQSDLQYLKEQVSQKDADLRTTISSLNDLQKQAFEDKGSLRSELGVLQARSQLLEEERLSATSQLAAKREECFSQARDVAQLKETVQSLEMRLGVKEGEAAAAKDYFIQLEVEKELRAKAETREDSERRERTAAMGQLSAIKYECDGRVREIEERSQASLEVLRGELTVAAAQRAADLDEIRRLSEVVIGLESQIEQLQHALENASVNHQSVTELGQITGELQIERVRHAEDVAQLESKHKELNDELVATKEKLRVEEVMRRRLHNQVAELKGNIRVFARVRPFLSSDGVDLSMGEPESPINAQCDLNSLRIVKKPTSGDERAEEHCFNFDRVFGKTADQETMFKEVSEFVQSALDGYNVCLFSYGQTGSGKTHTMQGSGDADMRGIIPRAMEQVGLYKNELETKGWQYQMQVSFVEIHNEVIRDLLRASPQEELKHEIKRDAAGNVFVSEVEMVDVDPNNTQQIKSIMELAARHRSVGQTAMNERSSRSHSIFALHLKATNASQGVVLKGTLNLVDLAGSERLDRSGATGLQMKETCAINKSLSALADVFVAISSKQPHVPFRNSKLTYLLQPALSGDGKTLMMVNLSPTEESFYESLCSLRLAKQVNQCELGKPKKQVKDAKDPSLANKDSTSSSSATATASTPSRHATSSTLSASMSNLSSALSGQQASAQSLSASMGSSRKLPNSSTAGNAPKRINLTKK